MNTSNSNTYLFENIEALSDSQIEALIDRADAIPDIDAEWEKFETSHIRKQNIFHLTWVKRIAAMFTGLVFVGFVYAISVAMGFAPNIFSSKDTIQDTKAIEQPSSSGTTTSKKEQVVYDNAPLSDIISDIAKYHSLTVTYKNEEVKDLRLYFKWDKSTSLTDNITALNAFERINIKIQDQTLTIE